MNLKNGLTAAAAAALLSGMCLGQTTTTLYLIKSENFDILSQAEVSAGVPNPDNTFWIGHSPTSISYGKGRLFISGIFNGAAFPLDGADADGDTVTNETTPFQVSIVKVNDILTVRTFSTVPGSRVSVPSSRGYVGMDYAPNVGATVRGLVATYDPGSGGTNLLSRYNVDLTGAGVRAAPVPDLFTGFRAGSAGPAWDFGPTGLGVDYAPSGALDGNPDGPVVPIIDFGNRGPYGTDPTTLNPGVGATLYELGVNNGPRLAPDTEGQLLWRDLAVDRRNGNFAARSDNTVTFCTRNADGTTTRVDLSPADPTTERIVPILGSFVIGQNITIMSGYEPAGVGDLLAWNDRSSGAVGQAFASVVKFNKTNRTPATDSGAPVAVTFLNPDNTPATFPASSGLYDFHWDSTTQILFVLDSSNRNVYFLSAEQPRTCCLSTGVCSLLNPTACASADVGGTVGAPGSTCAANPCSQTSGACCNDTACTIATAAACTGVFVGSGTTCDFVGNPVTCCKANFNQAGGVTVQDIFDFLAAYFTNLPSADINASGTVTVQDIFDFLSLYFAGCP